MRWGSERLRNLHSRAQAEEAIFHEAYGHYGIRELFGKEVEQKLAVLYARIGGSAGVARLAAKHGIDFGHYGQGFASLPIEQRRAMMVYELLAHIAQGGEPRIARQTKEFIGAVRDWLRQHGFPGLAKYGDTDIAWLLARARRLPTG
jgi:hypothetical protein